MDLMEKLSLYWKLVNIDINSNKSIRQRTGFSPGQIIKESNKKVLVQISKNIKEKIHNFDDLKV